jgi:hypothetical protein
MTTPREDTPVTRPHGLPKIRAVQPSVSGMAPAGTAADRGDKTIEELVGSLMAASAEQSRVIEGLSTAVGSLTGKLDGYLESSESRKKEIKEATTKATTHGSNRLALLMGAFLTLYEIASPMLHELAKWVQR